MRKYSVALLEPQGTFGNRQQFFAVDNLSGSTVKHSRRGCIIAGIDSQIIGHFFHPVFMILFFAEPIRCGPNLWQQRRVHR